MPDLEPRNGMSFDLSQALAKRFAEVIPGGAHTYAKGDDQFPATCAPYIARGRGCHVWDVDGNEFIEYGMGLRAVALGHAHTRVNLAVSRQMELGSNYTRPSPIELEAAEALRELVPGAEMVKFAKNGSDALSGAVKLARAYTGRDLVAICADHPFFSADDWFMATTPMNSGIPEAVRELTLQFRYNDLSSVEALFALQPGRIACVVLEAEKHEEPADGFLHRLQELCHRHGAVLILDEMITGFRWHRGGAQAYHNLVADLATFGKALGNGFAVSALTGRRELMRLGGLDHREPRVFLLSLTHGAENHSLAAALEVMRIYQEEPVIETLWRQGRKLQQEITSLVASRGLAPYFHVVGKPCCLTYATLDAEGKPSQAFRTLFLQETIQRGILAPSLIVSYAHTDADVDRTIAVIDQALEVYACALEEGVDQYLVGRPVKPVWRRFN